MTALGCGEAAAPKATDALITGKMLRPPKCLSIHCGEIITDSTPATRKPNSKYGAISLSTPQNSPGIANNVSIISLGSSCCPGLM